MSIPIHKTWTAHALLVLLISGCSANPAEREASETTPTFDLYLRDDLFKIKQALLAATARCMSNHGYPQLIENLPKDPSIPFPKLDTTASDIVPEGAKEIESTGFGRDAKAAPPRIVSFESDYDKQLRGCRQKKAQKLGGNVDKVLKKYYTLGNTLTDRFTQSMDKVRSSFNDELLDCVSKYGYAPTRPLDYNVTPTLSDFGIERGELENTSKKWKPDETAGGIQVSPPTPPREYIPTQEESQFAVATYKCKKKIGEYDELVSQKHSIEQRIARNLLREFDRLNPKIKNIAEDVTPLTKNAGNK